MGSALAWHDGVFAWPQALAALAGAILLQAGANLVNDLGDFLRGADRADRVGPTRLAQSGLASPGAIAWAAALVFLLATICGLVLIAGTVGGGGNEGSGAAGGLWGPGWPIVAIGVASILAAIAYTAGPAPFGYLGLGEVVVFAFFGPVAVTGTYFVQSGHWSLPALALSVPVGALACAVLLVNNIRDEAADARAGKNTVVVRFGPAFGRWLFRACVVVGVVGPAAIGLAMGVANGVAIGLAIGLASNLAIGSASGSSFGWAWLALSLLAAPLAVRVLTAVRPGAESGMLNRALVQTAALATIAPALAAVGLLLGR